MSQLELIPRIVTPATTITPNGAVLDEQRIYRYVFTRTWDPSLPTLAWCMLNSSTADENDPDNTTDKCEGFARRHCYGGITIGNLYAFRTKSPAVMIAAHKNGVDIVGPDNDTWLKHIMGTGTRRIVGGWGSTSKYGKHRAHTEMRIRRVVALANEMDAKFMAFGTNTDGSPKHPLYTSYDTPLSNWSLNI